MGFCKLLATKMEQARHYFCKIGINKFAYNKAIVTL